MNYYFEDYEVGQEIVAVSYVVTKQELIDYAKKWDSRPYHVDEEVAKSSIYGSVIAPSSFTIAIAIWLGTQSPQLKAGMGVLGYDRLEFPKPVYPGDILSLHAVITEKKESKSKSDRGIVYHSFKLRNQNDESVLTGQAKVLMAKRNQ